MTFDKSKTMTKLCQPSKKNVIGVVVIVISVYTILVTSKNFYECTSYITRLSPTSSTQDDTDSRKILTSKPRPEEFTNWEIFQSKKGREDYDLNPFRSLLEYNKGVHDILSMVSVFALAFRI